MTDQELKDLIAGNAIAIAELRQAQLKTDEQIVKLEKSQKKTDEQIKETAQQLKETAQQLKETDKKLKKIGKQLGDLGLVRGEEAEETVYRGIANLFRKRGKVFDRVLRNVKKKEVVEYDVVAINGSEILVVEVKNKLTNRMVDDFVKKYLPKLKTAFPEYKPYKILGGIGGMVVSESVEKYAEKQGLYVFVQSNDGNIEIANKKSFKGKVFG